MITATNVKQTSATTGTGNLTLAAAPTGFRAFSTVMTYGTAGGTSGEDWAPYYAESDDGSEWEFGVARLFNDAGNGELARATGVVFESSNSDALVSFTGATTVRLITPPDIRNYQRGVQVNLTSTAAIDGVGGTDIDWDSENNDTDSCWSVGTPDTIFIPAWAEEVEVYFFGETTRADPTAWAWKAEAPVLAYLASSGCENSAWITSGLEAYWPIHWTDSSTSTNMRGTGLHRLRVNRSAIDINSLASFTIREIDPANASSSWTTETFCRMRVIR